MYIRLQEKTRILDVKDTFAHLATIRENGDLEFEFTYSVSQRQVIDRKATTVRISVNGRNIVKKSLLGDTSRGRVDTFGLVRNIRTAMIDAHSANAAQMTYQIMTRDSDITAFINNDAIDQLRSRVPTSQIQSFNRPRLKLVHASDIKQGSDPQPILHRLVNTNAIPDFQQQLTSSLGEDPRELMHDMIFRQGLDPSYILNLAPRAQSEHASRSGLSAPSRAYEKNTDPAARLLNFFLLPPVTSIPPSSSQQVTDNEMVNVMQTVTSDIIDVPVTIVIPNSRLMLESTPLTQVFITFDLIDSTTGMSVDTVVKVLDLSKHLQIYYTPRKPPKVNCCASEIASRVNLEIRQVDETATEVQIYKKSVWISSVELDEYTLIGTYPLTIQDQTLLVQVDKPLHSPALYRVVPRGKQSIQGFEYTNVAIKPSRYTPNRSVSLTALPVDIGIQIEIRHIPTSVIAIQFLRKNLTTFDSAFTTVGDDIALVSDDIRQSDFISVVDTGISANNVYRYVARLIYGDGNSEDFGDATIEFIKPEPGAVDTKIENLTVDNDTHPNVTFTITTSTVDTNIDIIKRILEQQGIINHFEGDITAQRDELKQLIAHAVHRVDLTTGKREYFGVVTTTEFDDDAFRKNQAISHLEYGHKYRYEIYPLLRSAETMFEQFVKSSSDPVTNKSYSWSPAKYLHPMTLTRGVLVSPAGSQQRYAKDQMAFGIIGAITTVEVSFDQDAVKIVDPVASVFDQTTNVITWKTLGDLSQADHFIIFKEVHGIRTLIGKTHSEFPNNSCQYIHTVNHHDVGSLRYIIVPITNDYTVGVPAITNTIIVESLL